MTGSANFQSCSRSRPACPTKRRELDEEVEELAREARIALAA